MLKEFNTVRRALSRRSSLLTVALAGFATPVLAQTTVNIAWDGIVGALGYRVYTGSATRNYTNVIEAGLATTATIPNIVAGTSYYFAVTAYDALGFESPYSAELPYTLVLGRPSPITLKVAVRANRQVTLTARALAGASYDVLATSNFTTWSVIGTVIADASGGVTFTDTTAPSYSRRYYRIRGK